MTRRNDRPRVVGGKRKWKPAVSPNWSRARKTASMNIPPLRECPPRRADDRGHYRPGPEELSTPGATLLPPAGRDKIPSCLGALIMTAENHDATTIDLTRNEKKRAAASSVVAALGLTGMKLVVGLITGSLGILAEAAHSGLDLVAAFVTFMAVSVSDRPADESHTYGHGKVENFSALIETLLLFITCAWIIYEAVMRIFVRHVKVDPSLWAFLVVAVSIAIDVSRSRMLYRAASKHQSQALEADALHFSTDVWSSAVVLGGLVLVWIGRHVMTGESGLLNKADAAAALGVA